jgi:hypothetical protein
MLHGYHRRLVDLGLQKIDWFRLVDLPTWKRNKIVPGKFYLISPFVGYVLAEAVVILV